MQQADNILPVTKVSSVISRVIHFFGHSRTSTLHPDQFLNDIDWPDSNADANQSYNSSFKQPISGGYNEAYIVQYWTSYHLR